MSAAQMTYWPSGAIKEMFDPGEGVYRLYDQAGVLTGSRPLSEEGGGFLLSRLRQN